MQDDKGTPETTDPVAAGEGAESATLSAPTLRCGSALSRAAVEWLAQADVGGVLPRSVSPEVEVECLNAHEVIWRDSIGGGSYRRVKENGR